MCSCNVAFRCAARHRAHDTHHVSLDQSVHHGLPRAACNSSNLISAAMAMRPCSAVARRRRSRYSRSLGCLVTLQRYFNPRHRRQAIVSPKNKSRQGRSHSGQANAGRSRRSGRHACQIAASLGPPSIAKTPPSRVHGVRFPLGRNWGSTVWGGIGYCALLPNVCRNPCGTRVSGDSVDARLYPKI